MENIMNIGTIVVVVLVILVVVAYFLTKVNPASPVVVMAPSVVPVVVDPYVGVFKVPTPSLLPAHYSAGSTFTITKTNGMYRVFYTGTFSNASVLSYQEVSAQKTLNGSLITVPITGETSMDTFTYVNGTMVLTSPILSTNSVPSMNLVRVV